MSELQMEAILTKDFPRKLTLLGEGEQVNKATLLDYIKPRDCDSKLKFIVCEESLISGDAKIPPRIANVPPPKRGEELAAELTEKMQKTTLRREQLINSIVQKSRTYNEKILKAREKMFAKRMELSQNVEKDLQDKRCAAQLKREKIFQDKLERIKKHMEYAMAVRNKKSRKGTSSASEASDVSSISSSDDTAR